MQTEKLFPERIVLDRFHLWWMRCTIAIILSCLISVNDFKSDVTVPVVDEGGLKRSESYENFLHSGGVTIDGE